MERKEMLKELVSIFEEVFEVEDMEITEETNSDAIADWNSVNHLTLIGEIEQAFNIKFSMQEMLEIKSVKKILNIIEKEKK